MSDLNRTVRELLEGSLPVLWVSGEISNFKRYDSGHCYFSLKDKTAQVRCVMFRNRAGLLDFQPREGMHVEIRAVVTLYEARGDYQLTVEAMRPAGLGALFEAFEKLKAKLAAEGLFAAERKQSIPTFPKAVGIVTSPKAAALRDVLTTLGRRMPGLPVILYPCAVQGATAAAEIANAIRKATERNEVDTLIVCRGGGSLEDLWSFNEEVVARAIAECPIPLISGVGHETDFTIADFVADIRAATPTAAAELASPNRAEWLGRLNEQRRHLQRAFERQLQQRMQKLDALGRRLRHPGELLERQRERLQALTLRLQAAPARQLERKHNSLAQMRLRLIHAGPDTAPARARLERAGQRLEAARVRSLEQRAARLGNLAARLQALNPTAVLSRGYALVETANGKVVQRADQLHAGDRIKVRFADDAVDAAVTGKPVEQQELF
ncbi:exodeoxyribonuclease VII large subunit [Silvimonas sp.]|uniref:exodeoxyribonuclease VII large subunit n=1 Tax=Silvimonas sp. TaxID=2650811 RepID=UPI00283F5D65|nr:exodeoxyribonuclease VII large subunit [Silvimonas sp.]MDR3426788.1 exodeoxyribonuclease VII large subunit [Silvimonas sp.]